MFCERGARTASSRGNSKYQSMGVRPARQGRGRDAQHMPWNGLPGSSRSRANQQEMVIITLAVASDLRDFGKRVKVFGDSLDERNEGERNR